MRPNRSSISNISIPQPDVHSGIITRFGESRASLALVRSWLNRRGVSIAEHNVVTANSRAWRTITFLSRYSKSHVKGFSTRALRLCVPCTRTTPPHPRDLRHGPLLTRRFICVMTELTRPKARRTAENTRALRHSLDVPFEISIFHRHLAATVLLYYGNLAAISKL